MITWVCLMIALLSAGLACVMADMRRAVLSLWLCGLSVGGVFLAFGAEMIAVVQWIVSTLVAIAFIFYSMMFGEYGRAVHASPARPESLSQRLGRGVLPLLAAAGFSSMIVLGASEIHGPSAVEFGPQPTASGAEIMAQENVEVVGRALAEHHFISIEILGLMLLLAMIGSGVIARPEITSNETGDGAPADGGAQ